MTGRAGASALPASAGLRRSPPSPAAPKRGTDRETAFPRTPLRAMSDERPSATGLPDEATRHVERDDLLSTILIAIHPDLVFWARSLVRESDAEDVVQDAMLRYWRRCRRVPAGSAVASPTGDVRGDLFLLVRSVAQERHRTSARRGRLLTRIAGGVSAHHAAHISSPFISAVRRWMWPEAQVEWPELDPRLVRALEALSPTQRELVTLTFAHNLSLGEAATVVGISLSGARAHLSRAHARMRTALAQVGVDGSRSFRSTREQAPSAARLVAAGAVSAANTANTANTAAEVAP